MNRDILPVELHTGRHNSALFDFPDVLGHILLSSRHGRRRRPLKCNPAMIFRLRAIVKMRLKRTLRSRHFTIEMIFFTSFSFIHLLSSPSLSLSHPLSSLLSPSFLLFINVEASVVERDSYFTTSIH